MERKLSMILRMTAMGPKFCFLHELLAGTRNEQSANKKGLA